MTVKSLSRSLLPPVEYFYTLQAISLHGWTDPALSASPCVSDAPSLLMTFVASWTCASVSVSLVLGSPELASPVLTREERSPALACWQCCSCCSPGGWHCVSPRHVTSSCLTSCPPGSPGPLLQSCFAACWLHVHSFFFFFSCPAAGFGISLCRTSRNSFFISRDSAHFSHFSSVFLWSSGLTTIPSFVPPANLLSVESDPSSMSVIKLLESIGWVSNPGVL